MNWDAAIDLNRKALLRLLATLFAAAGIEPGGSVETLPRIKQLLILSVLRPIESAYRRLIVIRALWIKIVARAKSQPPKDGIKCNTSGKRVPSFPLFDPRNNPVPGSKKRRPKSEPRISFIGFDDPVFAEPSPEPSPDDLLDAERLCRRMASLQRALNDLPGQARRLARLLARRKQELNAPLRRVRPLRPGRPPGHRERATREVDEILRECHRLALWAQVEPIDTG